MLTHQNPNYADDPESFSTAANNNVRLARYPRCRAGDFENLATSAERESESAMEMA